MDERRTDPSLQDLNRGLLIAAAALLGLASLAGVAGFTVFGAAVVAAMRRWYQRADLAPHHLANLKWQQAKAAASAAAGASSGAWRDVEKNAYTPRSARH
jgi:hypothetical protein